MGGKIHRSGKKAGGRHTTLIDAAEKVYDYLNKIPNVTRIAAGQIKAALPVAPHRVIAKEITGGLSIKVRGTTSIQDLKVYSTDPGLIKKMLENKFD
jgi:ribosomal protein L13